MKNILKRESTGFQRAEVKACVSTRKADQPLGQIMKANGSCLLQEELVAEVLLPSESSQALCRNHQTRASCPWVQGRTFNDLFDLKICDSGELTIKTMGLGIIRGVWYPQHLSSISGRRRKS